MTGEPPIDPPYLGARCPECNTWYPWDGEFMASKDKGFVCPNCWYFLKDMEKGGLLYETRH